MSAYLKEVVCKAIDDEKEELYSISQDLWEHPELSYKEVYAHDKISDFLENHGFTVDRHFVVETGFRSTVGSRSNGPHIAVLCEYDALPEIGHACGHNLIAEVGLAAGLGIRAAFEANGKPLGKVTILGTPAEEDGGGKIDMVNAHVFDDVDVAMMAHAGHYNLSKFVTLAAEIIIVRYHGKAAHASAQPWAGTNALDAAILCYQNISCLRQQFKPGWQIHGVIAKGGSKPNIIPELTELEFNIRTHRLKDLAQLREKVVACFEAAGLATGCTCEISKDKKPYHDMVNNNVVSDLYFENAKAVGIDFENQHQNDTASTDMGNVSHVVPSIHPMFCISAASYHTKEFTKATGSKEAQRFTLAAAKALACTAIDIYTKPDLMAKINEDFKLATE